MVTGDFDYNDTTDLAFYRPVTTTRGTWSYIPIMLSNGDGSWSTRKISLPAGIRVHREGVKLIPGHFDGNLLTDFAIHTPGVQSSLFTVLLNGWSYFSADHTNVPHWVSDSSTKAIGVVGTESRGFWE